MNGAEAIVNIGHTVIKKRLPKQYRHETLDKKLRKQRTKREAKVLQKVVEFMPVPKVLTVSDYEIEMERVHGAPLKKMLTYATEIGTHINSMHARNIVHGDLTGSNILIGTGPTFIDFGLAKFNAKVEDKAVDLFLFERNIVATHGVKGEAFMQEVYIAYGNKEVLNKLEDVRRRGRHKA
jgi:TP53 regulating kinase and related kinases